MKVFVWKRVEKCTDNYHPEGGVVVFAETEEAARALALTDGCDIRADELPTYVTQCPYAVEKVFLFQDAGCC